MPLTMADQRRRIAVLTVPPADPENGVTLAEANAATRLECRILRNGTVLGATGNGTVDEKLVCEPIDSTKWGNRQFEGQQLVIARFLTPAGLADAINDVAFTTFKEPTELWIIDSEGPLDSAAFAAGQEYDLFRIETVKPTKPTERTGYIKRIVPFSITRAFEELVFSAA